MSVLGVVGSAACCVVELEDWMEFDWLDVREDTAGSVNSVGWGDMGINGVAECMTGGG